MRSWVFGSGSGDQAGWKERAGTRRFTAWNAFQAAFAGAANGPVDHLPHFVPPEPTRRHVPENRSQRTDL